MWLVLFPMAWISMGFLALPALGLMRSRFDPKVMRLNWCCVPRYHHHRTPVRLPPLSEMPCCVSFWSDDGVDRKCLCTGVWAE